MVEKGRGAAELSLVSKAQEIIESINTTQNLVMEGVNSIVEKFPTHT